MTVRVRFFATLRERVGQANVDWRVAENGTVGELWAALCTAFPALRDTGAAVTFAVNQEYVDSFYRLHDNDEIAIIPPVSGGCARMYSLTSQSIDLNELVMTVRDPAAGATATFLGVTRNHNKGRRVLLLEYEAYAGMAEREMQRIGSDAMHRWSIRKIAIVHRTGRVLIGEASVAIAVSAPHRADAFAACQFAIDQLKATVPIWKKEFFEGGEVWIGCEGRAAPGRVLHG